jgi:hypothetical protein
MTSIADGSVHIQIGSRVQPGAARHGSGKSCCSADIFASMGF